MKSKAKWQKIGWRSLRHNGEPKLVVRFGPNGAGKIKLLCDEWQFKSAELGAGRRPDGTLMTLLREAEAHWKALELKEVAK